LATVLFGAVLLASIPSFGGARTVEEGLTPDRFDKTEKLIEESSAARKVKSSGDAAAEAKREKARDLLRQARAFYDVGDREAAERLLKQATSALYEAVRMIPEDQSLVDKRLREYDERLKSVEALRAAYSRIREEKGLDQAGPGELTALVEEKIGQAEAARAAGLPEQGRRILDQAYVAAKVAIEHLRGGETVVHALHFETKEEEYLYELDRNHTHRLLVDLLLAEQRGVDEVLDRQVDDLVHEAWILREQAEEEAARGDFAEAVSTIEESTRELLRAMRSAGVFIPG
jgi:hypothetical protein